MNSLNLPGGVRGAIEIITPGKARQILQAAGENRKLNDRMVSKYAADMIKGLWYVNGEAIKIDTQGRLLDGQHRLWACIRADKPFSTMIVIGLPPESRLTMDQGRKRSMADQLQFRGVVQAGPSAAICRLLHAWEEGRVLGSAPSRPPTVHEVLAIKDRWPTMLDSIRSAKDTVSKLPFRRYPTATLGLFLVLARTVDPDHSTAFAHLLGHGAGMDLGHPVLGLRNHLIDRACRGHTDTRTQHCAWLLQAWLCLRHDKTRKRYQKSPLIDRFPGLVARTGETDNA